MVSADTCVTAVLAAVLNQGKAHTEYIAKSSA